MIQLPYDDAAERALLGALLINPEAMRGLNLTAEDVYIERNRVVFEAMAALSARHANVDYLTVSDALKTSGKLKEIGGGAFLTELLSDTPNSLHAEDYAGIIRDRARRRRVILATQKLTQAAFNLGANLDEAVALAASDIVTTGGGTQSRHIGEVLSELYDEIEAASQNPRDIFGIPTGLSGFDGITYGLQRKQVFMLSGEPGVGKSFLAFQLCVGAATGSNGIKGTPGAVFELEMSDIATVRRSLSARAKVRSKLMRQGKITPDDWTTLTAAIEDMSALPIWLNDDTDMTTTALRAEIARLKTHGIGWVLVDYMALLKDEGGKDDNERVGIISARLHDIAKSLDVAMIVISDMTKDSWSNDKGQAALAGSRKISYNSDMTALLKKTKTDDIFNLEWVKYREDDPERVLPLRRVPGFPAYAEVRSP